MLNGGEDFRTSLVFVTDVIDGIMRIMNAPVNPGPVNLGSDFDLALKDVAQMIINQTGSSAKMVPGENFEFLSELALPRVDKIKDLGWFPLVRLEDGIRRTIEYMKANKLLLTSL